MPKKFRGSFAGFTLIELVIIIAVVGVLMALTYSYAVPKYRERTYLTSANTELHTLADSVTLYLSKYNDYPADADRNLPPDLMQFIQTNNKVNWPAAPWPGSTYDFDNWSDWAVHGSGEVAGPIIQFRIHFCNDGDTAGCKKHFPDEPWVTSSWDSKSTVYYCIHGPCRTDQNQAANYAGYCINCSPKQQFF